MHDNKTVAHQIYFGKAEKKNGHYRTPIITIWHVDPETDGTDDSCGWFIRLRHIDKKVVECIKREMEYSFDEWFIMEQDGTIKPRFSVSGTTLGLYKMVMWKLCILENKSRKHSDRFFRKHTHDLLHFAENHVDSIGDVLTNRWGAKQTREGLQEELVSIILPHIYRLRRKWWQHPKWHIHHWSIQIPVWQNFRRRYFDRCSICGRRGFKQSAHSNWEGSKIWCSTCNEKTYKNGPRKK